MSLNRRAFGGWRGLLASAALAVVLAGAGPARAQSHPLDPLTGNEIVAAVSVLQNAGKVNQNSRFPIIRLEEPPKQFVKSWQPGQPLQRKAFVMVYQNTDTFEAIVDLHSNTVQSWKKIPGVQPPVLAEEYTLAHTIAISDPTFQARLALRGITDTSPLICLPLSAGNDLRADEQGKRLLRVTCLTTAGNANAWARPIENLTAVVDLEAKKVLRVIDGGITPLSTADASYPPANVRPPPKPLDVSQPQGSDAVINGNVITWDNWKFHARVEQREGLVISDVSFNDHGQKRDILYRGGLGEIFVPYADTTSNWYFRTYMDEGEYGFGKSVQPLTAGIDCPANAQFIDVTLADDYGHPFTVPHGICVFERTPHLLVRHFDIFTLQTLSIPGRELVVRFATVVGNYDYMTEWVFSQDGTILIRSGAGGIMAAKGVSVDTIQQDTANETASGPLVDPKLTAVMHQHFFNFRLDIDVDGTDNQLVKMERKIVPNPHNTPRATTWILEEEEITKEGVLDDEHGHYLVKNATRRNKVGYNTGYTVTTHDVDPILLSPQDIAYQRARFATVPAWVTRYNYDEKYSAGDYPNESLPGEGLPKYANNQSIKNKDLVLWVNVSLGHVPRTEEWPVMPTEWFGTIELKPYMFFDTNPALDVSQVR